MAAFIPLLPVSLGLFFAMLFGVSHHRFFSVLPGVNHVAPSGMCMVCRLFMMSGIVVLGRFPVVASGMRQMF
jgi:hypothetical protein